MNFDYNKIYKLVENQLKGELTGHSIDHIENVINNAKLILKKEPKANKDVVILACLLHDCDDYKIVGVENADNKVNAKQFMNQINIPNEIEEHVIDICHNMGYSNYLEGIRPETLEGKIVSDADMLDATGANGIIRACLYMAHDIGVPVFDKNIWPRKNLDKYTHQHMGDEAGLNHFFERILLLKNIMFTDVGKEISLERHKVLYTFLESYFREINAHEWGKYLKDFA